MKKYSGRKKKSRKKEQEKRRQKLGMMKSGFALGVRRKKWGSIVDSTRFEGRLR
jgi:hypothetical protein